VRGGRGGEVSGGEREREERERERVRVAEVHVAGFDW